MTSNESARVAITGSSGFLGSMLARRLLTSAGLSIRGGAPSKIEQIVLLDLVAPPEDLRDEPLVRALTGPLDETIARLEDVDVICHLAGVVSAAAEADFELGMHTNIDLLRDLLEQGRGMSAPPVFVFTSSLAVFGSEKGMVPPDPVTDSTLPLPQSSYGAQKYIGELLVSDYARRGYVHGRSVRLMTVAVRPGKPNAAASGFMSGIIREPLAGIRSRCPIPPDMPVALSSPSRTIEGILAAIETGDEAWGGNAALTLPSLTTTPGEMLAALDAVSQTDASRLVEWGADDAIRAIVSSWPSRFDTARARGIGLTGDPDFESIIREYLALIECES